MTSTSNELGVLEVVVPGVGDNHHPLSSGTCAPMYGCDAAVSAKVSIAPNQVSYEVSEHKLHHSSKWIRKKSGSSADPESPLKLWAQMT